MSTTDTTLEAPAAGDAIAGIIAQFASAQALLAAADRLRQEGFRRWDAHSPMPVHGLERAMGIRLTILPWLALGAGLTGAVVALGLQWFANAVQYPLNVSGKPLFSLPAFIPVTFELIVLFSSLTAFVGAIALSLLPQYWHGAFTNRAFRRVTTDGFFISLDARDYRFDAARMRGMFASLGATSIETYCEPADGRALPSGVYWAVALLLVMAPIPLLLVAWMRVAPSSHPRIHLLFDMDAQPKYKMQAASPFFVDGRAERPQVPGTVARGSLRRDPSLLTGRVGADWSRTYPESISLDLRTMRRGRERFEIYCAPCHGLAGDGDGLVSARAQERGEVNWVPPVQLSAPAVRLQPVGYLFHTITHGVRKMPAYAAQILPEDRWAIVLYLQALQRSQSATVDDLPPDVRAHLTGPR